MYKQAPRQGYSYLKDRRVPEGEHGKPVKTVIIILLNLVFAPSHCDGAVNKNTIAKSGVVPFTKCARAPQKQAIRSASPASMRSRPRMPP